MKKVTLYFPSIDKLWEFVQLINLWEFVQLIKPSFLEVDTKDKLVTCICNDQNIQLAVRKYGARIIGEEPETETRNRS